MDTRLYLTIAAIVAIVYALGFLLIPTPLSLLFSDFAEPRAVLNLRFCGAAILAWGVILWFARDFQDWAAVRAILIGSVVGLAVNLIINVCGHDSRLAQRQRVGDHGRARALVARGCVPPRERPAKGGVRGAPAARIAVHSRRTHGGEA